MSNYQNGSQTMHYVRRTYVWLLELTNVPVRIEIVSHFIGQFNFGIWQVHRARSYFTHAAKDFNRMLSSIKSDAAHGASLLISILITNAPNSQRNNLCFETTQSSPLKMAFGATEHPVIENWGQAMEEIERLV